MIRPDIDMLPRDFLERWANWFPAVPAVGFLIREAYPERWLRVHSLPRGRRYPESGWDHAELLRRHDAVATQIIGEGAKCAVIFFSPCEGTDASEVGRLSGLSAGALQLVSRLHPELWDEATGVFAEPMCLFGCAATWRSSAFNAFISAVAADRVRGLVVSLASGAVYAPYDGGADLFFASSW